MLEVRAKAPEFTLPDKDGSSVSLTDFAGKKVVLYFYPRDNTLGCTRQACAFAGAFEEFKKIDAVVVGISKSLFKIYQNAIPAHLFPLDRVDLTGNTQSIPASNRLAQRKNLRLSGIPPDFKQALSKPSWNPF